MNKRIVIVLPLALIVGALLYHLAYRDSAPDATPQRMSQPAATASAFLRPPGTGRATNKPDVPPEQLAEREVPTNIYARLLAGEEIPPLTPEQIAPYLEANHRNAESLIAGYLAAGHQKALLDEAKQKYPNDPHVAYFAAVKADSPEERQQWVNAFKQAAPDNPLPNYLSALDHFKDQQTGAALQDLAAAAAQPKYQDYSVDFIQSSMEAYLAAGYSEVDAKGVAGAELILPQLAQLKQLGVNLADYEKSAQQAGDTASAQAAMQAGMTMGQRLEEQGGGNVLITDLVGIAVERLALGAMDPTSPYGDSGQTVQDQIDQAINRRQTIRAMVDQFQAIEPQISEPDLISYFDRRMTSGEQAAEQWVIRKYGEK
jgi:hypothetical protein